MNSHGQTLEQHDAQTEIEDTGFLIVVPTRNRSRTLTYTIESVITQDYQNFRLLILDNASSDATSSLCRDYTERDRRVTVLRSERGLTMTDNWERAIPTLLGTNQYVTFIGDDDGLLPGALQFAAQTLRLQPAAVLSWKKAEYCWPDVALPGMSGYLSFFLSSTIRRIPTQSFLMNIHDFSCGYDLGPSIYSAFVRADLICHVVKQDGARFFRSCSPDVYSAFVLSAYAKSILRCSFPLSINGASGASNGIAQTNEIKNEEASSFLSKNVFHPVIRHGEGGQQPITVTIAEADSLATAHDFHKEALGIYNINIDRLAEKILNDLSLISESSRRRRGLEHIYLRLSGKAEVPVCKGQLKCLSSGFARGVRLHEDGPEIVADLTTLGDSDVQTAGKYINSLLDLSRIEINILQDSESHSECVEPRVQNRRSSRFIGRLIRQTADALAKLLKKV
ncbi:glycosyltransferase family 2 protein [Cyanobium gracile]|uniref:Glycosyl transferase n=1 Tax=Cyanobium gracile (strain ATCC 27147 / PCC 6307) TaxID=292564 RepID=K9P8V1_CYAGP|nr:glycosyltransferase family A protein [Cyanobium gracile]AFY29373.1 glycosyl transferase [Cyanobium gracile PCC 6307]